jgi:hypothetical protein
MIKLTKVTLTGADDSVKQSELFRISKDFPYVEWGLLVSRKSQGNRRFPSREWLRRLSDLEGDNLFIGTQYSMHLCGQYAREILLGDDTFTKEVGGFFQNVQRVQINTHGTKHDVRADPFLSLMNNNYIAKQVIFQIDGNNQHLVDISIGRLNCAGLFDLSHGEGRLPADWPRPLDGLPCGYAGGLAPDNLEEQLTLLADRVGSTEVWIDMETHLRSDGGKKFDLKKAVRVLEICERYAR